MNLQIPNKTRVFEIAAVLLTGIGKFVFINWLATDFRLIFISIAILFWIAYIIFRLRQDKRILDYWGLSMRNFKKTFLELLPVAAVCVAAFILIGNYRETNILDWSIIPILILYPLWGIIQQFIIIALIARNLKDFEGLNLSNLTIILITASLFSLVHFPSILLIIATLFLGLVYTTLYLKGRNLLVFGIYHGWLAAFFFYAVLERNPWLEVFGMLG